MKSLTILTAALIGAVAFPTLTMAKTVLGCEVFDNGGVLNKVDPTCVFSNERTGSGTRLVFGDFDGNPSTPDTLGQKDT